MPHAFGSPEWAGALQDGINGSSEYRNAGAGWGDGFNGNILFVFESADPPGLLIRLEAGSCSGVEFVAQESHADAGFVLRAPFALWQDILNRKTMAATAILTGKLKVEGDKMQLLKYTAAHRALVHCAASVDTTW